MYVQLKGMLTNVSLANITHVECKDGVMTLYDESGERASSFLEMLEEFYVSELEEL